MSLGPLCVSRRFTSESVSSRVQNTTAHLRITQASRKCACSACQRPSAAIRLGEQVIPGALESAAINSQLAVAVQASVHKFD